MRRPHSVRSGEGRRGAVYRKFSTLSHMLESIRRTSRPRCLKQCELKQMCVLTIIVWIGTVRMNSPPPPSSVDAGNVPAVCVPQLETQANM